MEPWVTLSSASGPDGAPLVLQQRGDEFAIRIGGHVLMGSKSHGSEDAMAEAVELGSARRVLVGGLGLGFTLRAVLDRIGPSTRVMVSELLAAVVDWNKGPVAHLANSPLADPRVHLELEDVRKTMKARPDAFDAILLDVDNGPAPLSALDNRRLYSDEGLAIIRRALTHRGQVVFWSAGEDPPFVRRLEENGFEVRVRPAAAHSGKSRRHVLFVAQRRAPRAATGKPRTERKPRSKSRPPARRR